MCKDLKSTLYLHFAQQREPSAEVLPNIRCSFSDDGQIFGFSRTVQSNLRPISIVKAYDRTFSMDSTGWLKIKYPSRQYATGFGEIAYCLLGYFILSHLVARVCILFMRIIAGVLWKKTPRTTVCAILVDSHASVVMKIC